MQNTNVSLREHAKALDLALNSMQQGLIMFDRSAQVVVCNERYLDIYRLLAAGIKPGSDLVDVLRSEAKLCLGFGDPEQMAARILARIRGGEPAKYLVETIDGRTISVVEHLAPRGGWVVTHEDVSEGRRTQALIADLTFRDALTGIANRTRFHDCLEQAVKYGRRRLRLAVLIIDLDNFRAINDTLGHSVGDNLLKQTAERLEQCLDGIGIVARLGGDEFGILQNKVRSPSEAAALARSLQEVFAAPFSLGNQQILASASIGVALIPDDSTDPDDLLKKADIALYGAKAGGRGTYKFFEKGMDDRVKARRGLELDLRCALDANELELHYQPIVNLAADSVCGCEALLRWNHRTRGLVPPAQFIPVAEETGLIRPLGEWVMRTACAVAAAWPAQIKIAINVSPAQLNAIGFVGVVVDALQQAHLPPHRLEIEITEALLMQGDESTLRVLYQLREIGVRIVMDDFGTGFSSLSYLRRFPFDKIKIDQSFVRELSNGSASDAILRTVVNLANQFRMTTTAEGVETHLQKMAVKASGCTEMQGFLISRPRTASSMIEFFNAWNWTPQVGNAARQPRAHGRDLEAEVI